MDIIFLPPYLDVVLLDSSDKNFFCSSLPSHSWIGTALPIYLNDLPGVKIGYVCTSFFLDIVGILESYLP